MRRNAVVSLIVGALFVAVHGPQVTGAAFHEWVGVVLFALLAVHLAFNGEWVVRALRSLCARPVAGEWAVALLNGGMLLSFAAATVSGLFISATVLPALGCYAEGYFYWTWLHSLSAKVLMALLLVHLALRLPVLKRGLARAARPARPER